MTVPKISVVVPSINGVVPRSIPIDARLEIIVVKYVSPVGKARNEGLRRATGEYVAWVDADDEVTEDWLPEILAALESSPDVVTIDAKLVGWVGRGDLIWGVKLDDATIERLRRDVYRDISRSSALWLYVSKRKLWDELIFDEDIRVAEDYLILPKVLERAESCRYVPKKLYRYIYNGASLINTLDFKHGTMGLIEQWARRLSESPYKYRGQCLWGMAVSLYWVCDSVCVDPEQRNMPYAMECAAKCGALIRQHMFELLREALFAKDLGFCDRIFWYLRFLCAAVDWWWIQRLRYRRRHR